MSSFLGGNIQFKSDLKRKAEGLKIMQIIDMSTGAIIEYGVTANWSDENGQIVISHITGLKPSTRYKIRFLTF